MIAHTTLHVSDYRRSKSFYTQVLTPLGYRNNMEFGEAAGFNDGKNTDFWMSREANLVPTHLAFETDSRGKVEAFHRAALAAGAIDNGPPGYREYSPGYYAAFVLDPDGHNIEAVWYDPTAAADSPPDEKVGKSRKTRSEPINFEPDRSGQVGSLASVKTEAKGGVTDGDGPSPANN